MKPLSVVVRTGCDMFAWFMVVFGTYVIIHGYKTPGGGFQGGAVVATFAALLLVAYGGEKVLSWISLDIYNTFLTAGLLLFLLFGFAGMGTSFLYNFLAVPEAVVHAGGGPAVIPPSGTIALMDIAVGLEVAGGLTLIILYMFKGSRLEINSETGGETGHDSW